MKFRKVFGIGFIIVCVSGCGSDDGASLRAGLESLPRDTSSGADLQVIEPDPLESDSTLPELDEDSVDAFPTLPPSSGSWTTERVVWERDLEGIATLVDVRTARQDGFDRIVLEFADELPGYRVEYVGDPITACGSGFPVEVAGVGRLHIGLTPARAHTEEGASTLGQRQISLGMPAVAELVSTCDFEGRVDWVVGVESPTQFRVLTLPAPSRLVVDVRH